MFNNTLLKLLKKYPNLSFCKNPRISPRSTLVILQKDAAEPPNNAKALSFL